MNTEGKEDYSKKDLNDILKSALIRNGENADAEIYQRMMNRQGDAKSGPKFIDAEATSNWSHSTA